MSVHACTLKSPLTGLSSYIKSAQPVHWILKMAWCSLDTSCKFIKIKLNMYKTTEVNQVEIDCLMYLHISTIDQIKWPHAFKSRFCFCIAFPVCDYGHQIVNPCNQSLRHMTHLWCILFFCSIIIIILFWWLQVIISQVWYQFSVLGRFFWVSLSLSYFFYLYIIIIYITLTIVCMYVCNIPWIRHFCLVIWLLVNKM